MVFFRILFRRRRGEVRQTTRDDLNLDWGCQLAIRRAKTDLLATQLPKLLEHVTTPMESLKACWIAPVITNMVFNNFQRLVQCADGPIEGDFFEFETFMKVLEPEMEVAKLYDDDSTAA